MPAASLRERLTRLGAAPRPRAHFERALPRGFELVPTPFGEAALRQDVIPLPALEPDPGSVAYVDTETTGLSGGAGTYVFAAAVARPIDSGLRVAQLFLPQPGMEAAFLHALGGEMAPAVAVSTFNGSSFDLPVLRTRWVMARMPGELPCPLHVDLLTLVRALYKHRLENCNLRSVTTRLATVTVYEMYPGGVGYSIRMFELHRELLEHAAALVRDCQCLAGCPSCIGPLHLVEGAKEACLQLLSASALTV